MPLKFPKRESPHKKFYLNVGETRELFPPGTYARWCTISQCIGSIWSVCRQALREVVFCLYVDKPTKGWFSLAHRKKPLRLSRAVLKWTDVSLRHRPVNVAGLTAVNFTHGKIGQILFSSCVANWFDQIRLACSHPTAQAASSLPSIPAFKNYRLE